MVRFDWKLSLFEASCCNVEVINGGAGAFLVTFFLTLVTSKFLPSSLARILLVSSSV